MYSTLWSSLSPDALAVSPYCRCVFLPNNGAFFVNYVITASLIGTAMELLRIPGLTVYATRLCLAKSVPERLHVKRVCVSTALQTCKGGGEGGPSHAYPDWFVMSSCRVRPMSSSLAWSMPGPHVSSP